MNITRSSLCPPRRRHRSGVQLGFVLSVGILWAVASLPLHAADHPSRGLWVGQITVDQVNQVVVGINAANDVVAPDPTERLRTPDQAHLRVLLHVDGNGLVRLLKGVALLPRTSRPSPDGDILPGTEVPEDDGSTLTDEDIALVTDETLFADFDSLGFRVASAAFDFGEGNGAAVLNQLAEAASDAAADAAIGGASEATITSQTDAAVQGVLDGADLDALYGQFLSGTLYTDATSAAAEAASIAAVTERNGGGTAEEVLQAAREAASTATEVVRVHNDATNRENDSILLDTRYVSAVETLVAAAADAAAEAANAADPIPLDAAAEAAVEQAASAAATAAAAAAAGATSPVSSEYNDFIATDTLGEAADDASDAAVAAAVDASSQNLLPSTLRNLVSSAALKAITGAVREVDNIIINEVRLSGELSAGQKVEGNIYLGAFHPTNPFRHFLHPSHSEGFPITRQLAFIVDTPEGEDPFEPGGFGVSRLTGTYEEEIFGLHKKLGPDRNIGLRTKGTFELSRISLVDTLNQ